MSVGRSSGFYPQFQDLFFDVRHLPFVETWQGDADVEEREAAALAQVAQTLDECGDNVAAFLAEPLLQGASGMRLCRPQYLRALCQLMRDRGILVIFDEVMTGFGRTGTFFAMEQVGFVPDIVCLSKGITGGFLPLAATVASPCIYESFLGADFSKAFAHGHSFTANPLGCAAALASLSLFETEGTLKRIGRIHMAHGPWLDEIARIPGITRPRRLGSIAAVNVGHPDSDYHASIGPVIKAKSLEHGLLIRPMGNVVYLMPPACVTPEELARAQNGLAQLLRQYAKG
jgi:adenosylmethionine-8-amino-7-oxononanoate aminotransferase